MKQTHARVAIGLVALGVLGFCHGTPAFAQYAHICQRNGEQAVCTVTPLPDATSADQSVEMITFADRSIYIVSRDERSCEQISEHVRTCTATILPLTSKASALAACYRGTYQEGSYKHDYISPGIHLTTTFVD